MATLALRRLSQRLALSRTTSSTPQLFIQGCSNRRWFSEQVEVVPEKKKRTRKAVSTLPKDEAESVPKKRVRKSTKKVTPIEEPAAEEESADPSAVGTRRRRKSVFVDSATQRRKSVTALRGHVKSEEYVPDMSKLQLPPIDDWRPHFPWAKDIAMRASVRHPDTAAMLAEAFLPEGSKDKIVLEANSGPGQLTRALLNLPRERLKKLIVMEHGPHFYEYVKPLEAIDDRIVVLPYNAKDWSTYNRMRDTGLLDDVQTIDWKQEHPQLQFIMSLSASVEGEQLLSQLFRAIPDRQWLFKYGRIPMHFILSNRMWQRSIAPEDSKHRCKVSVIGQAAAEMKEVVPFESLQPFSDHFHPRLENRTDDDISSTTLNERRMGTQHLAIRVTPWADHVIKPRQLDFWDYCLRNLFVQKATPLSKAINTLGPGGYNLLPKLEAQGVDINQTSRGLTVQEWAKVVQTFQDWPFRPEDLSIDSYMDGGNNSR